MRIITEPLYGFPTIRMQLMSSGDLWEGPAPHHNEPRPRCHTNTETHAYTDSVPDVAHFAGIKTLALKQLTGINSL